MSSGVVQRHSSDPSLLWLWHRLAAAALVGPLAWELPYATGMTLKSQKKKKKGKKGRKEEPRRGIQVFTVKFFQLFCMFENLHNNMLAKIYFLIYQVSIA